MTTAGEVDVKLGLDSAEFIKNLNAAEKEFKDLQKNLKQSQADFDKVSKAMAGMKNPTKEMSNLFNEVKNKLQQDQKAFDNFNNKLKGLQVGVGQTNPIIGQITGALGKLAGPTAAIAATKALIDLGKQSIQTAAQFEQLAVSFEVLAGGADAGEKLTNQIIELASKTPLTTEALSDGARTLLSFGESSEAVVDDLKLLGDITGGDTQRMQSLTLAFAQVGSTGRLMGQDLMQMVNAGFNPLSIMSEKTGKSMAQLKDEMSKGLITFADVKQAMIDATSEGGRFYGMMNKQSQTLDGRMSTLNDKWQIISKSIGDVFMPVAKEAVDIMIKLTDATINTSKAISDWVAKESTSLQGLSKQWDKYWISRFKKRRKNTMVFEVNDDWLEKERKSGLFAKTPKKETKEKESTAGFLGMSGGTAENKKKKQRDKALDEYKKYIEQYNKLTNDYQGTLKARQYLENTLHIDPITQQQEYNELLNIYKNYFAKMQEIATSGAKNKAEIQKLEEENLARQLQEIRVNKELETQRKLYDIQKGYQKQSETITRDNENISFMGGLTSGLFGDAYKRKLELEKWYQDERQKIIKESNGNIEAQNKAFADLEILRNKKTAQDNLNTWQQYGSDVASILNGSFENIINGQQTFSEAMKSLMLSLYKELIKMAWNAATKEIEIEKWKVMTKKALNAITGFFSGGFGGLFGKAVGVATGVGTSIVGGGGMMYPVDPILDTYHSGGVVPGTKEQLAVLKGGERVLNPSENASYTSNNEEVMPNGVSNIMMFNIKAWDGKDVIQTLKANSQTINQIVSSGIKNNNQGLRTTVQNI